MESRFARDFSSVRVHTGAEASAAARSLEAAAFTLGRDIVFADGRYTAGTGPGRELLVHELTHVVQQEGTGARGGAGAALPAGEREAAQNARLARDAPSRALRVVARATGVQRQAVTPSPATAEADDLRSRILAAAEQARKESGDATALMIRGASIVYRMVKLYLPGYSGRISGAGYDPAVESVRVGVAKDGSLSISVGKAFILGLDESTIDKRALDLGGSILQAAPRKERGRGPLGAMAVEARRAEQKKREPRISAQDAAAIEGLKKARCLTAKDNKEWCGLVIDTGKGSFRITGPVPGSEKRCDAEARSDQHVVAYYHSHTPSGGEDFSQASSDQPMGDRDESEDRKWDYYVVGSKGGMLHYIPSGDIAGGRGPTLEIGTAPECPRSSGR
jgi:hypothetical protein